MLTALAIALGLLSITIHELGHYEAMRRCGIKIREVALLGIPLPFLPSFYRKIGDTVWGIHPFIIGAYVMAEEEEDVRSKSLKDQLYIYASGPIANIVYSFVLLGVVIAISGFQDGFDAKIAIGIIVFCGIALSVWYARRSVALILPVLMIPILLLIIYSLFSSSPMKALEEGSGGPVAVINFLVGPESVAEALLRAAVLSFNLALINLMPVIPLDGGRMASVIVKTWIGRRFEALLEYVSIPLIVSLIIYCLSLDAVRIWNGVW